MVKLRSRKDPLSSYPFSLLVHLSLQGKIPGPDCGSPLPKDNASRLQPVI